jgi:nitroreductase
MSLIDSLSWRYATKRMTGNKVSAEKIDSLLEAIRLSASGFGLQPYKILVIENPELNRSVSHLYLQVSRMRSSVMCLRAMYRKLIQFENFLYRVTLLPRNL